MAAEPRGDSHHTRPDRRRFLRRMALSALGLGVVGYAGLAWLGRSRLAEMPARGADRRNFHSVYGDPALKAQFEPFLANVFHLYPEQALHALIARTVAEAP